MSAFRGTARFLPRRCLGAGSFGSVHEAFDLERQSLIALKIPHEATASSLFLFKKEFRTLADISHPNLVAFHELVSNGDQWFFTMELVEGRDLLSFLRVGRESEAEALQGTLATPSLTDARPAAPLNQDLNTTEEPTSPEFLDSDEDELPPVSAPADFRLVTRTFLQLGHGLMAIHAAGLLHQDIKPSNVLVTHKGRVVLLDFGLSSEIDPVDGTSSEGSGITGTPAYTAPEQLFDKQCTVASDWYSVGVLLYHVLTGRLPFQGNGLRAMVNKVAQEPPAPAELIPGVPSDLSALCMELLRPHPADRPAGEAFLRRLEQTATTPAQSRRAPPGAGLVVRTQELDQLFLAFQKLLEGAPGWVNLHGGSGLGKTFLIRKFRREVKRATPEALILGSRCYEQEDVPYKALDGLVDALSQHLRGLSPEKREAFLPRHIAALAQIFPVLRQLAEGPETRRSAPEIADPQALRHRAFGALRELLQRIGEERPLILIIDDLHWGDADSLTLLTDLLTPPNPPLMLLVACFRTEECSTSPILREFLALGRTISRFCIEVPLKEVQPPQACLLALELLDQDDPASLEQAQWIARESGGNPFFIHELATHAQRLPADSGTIGQLGAYIRGRAELLPLESRRILQLVALAGYPLDWQVVRQAADAGASGIDALDALRQWHLIRIRAIGARRMIEPYHDLVRKAIATALSHTEAQQGHLCLAQALEATPNPDVQAMALHYKAAGKLEKAIGYVTSAGLQAAAALAFGRAASHFRMSLSLRPPDDPEMGVIWGHLGEALANLGRGREAAEAYLRAVPLALPGEAQRLHRLAAQEYLRNGHLEEGLAALKAALEASGSRLASSRFQALLSTLYHKALVHAHGLEVRERAPREIPQAVLDRLDAYWVATVGLAAGDLIGAADFQSRQLLLSLQTGEPFRLVRALAYEAIYSSALGVHKAATTQKFLDLALMYAERLADPNPMSQALIAAGLAHTTFGHWRKGAELLDRVEAMLRENSTGLTYELRNAQSFSLMNHYALGDLKVVSERLPALFRDAEESGDLLFLANLKTGSAFIHHLAHNEPGIARKEIRETLDRLSPKGFFHQRYLEMVALGNIDLYARDPLAGWEQFNQRWNALAPSQLMLAQVIRITCLELRGRMALAVASNTLDRERRRSFRSLAGKDAKALRKEGADYASALAHRLEAIAAWLDGEREEALKRIFLAEMAFDACDMALHANTMKRCRGLLRGSQGKELVVAAETWMQGQGIVDASRMMAMYLPGIDAESR